MYGGGGGGIIIHHEMNEDNSGTSFDTDSGYSFGQGGDGYEGNSIGNDGAVLLEIEENRQCQQHE